MALKPHMGQHAHACAHTAQCRKGQSQITSPMLKGNQGYQMMGTVQLLKLGLFKSAHGSRPGASALHIMRMHMRTWARERAVPWHVTSTPLKLHARVTGHVQPCMHSAHMVHSARMHTFECKGHHMESHILWPACLHCPNCPQASSMQTAVEAGAEAGRRDGQTTRKRCGPRTHASAPCIAHNPVARALVAKMTGKSRCWIALLPARYIVISSSQKTSRHSRNYECDAHVQFGMIRSTMSCSVQGTPSTWHSCCGCLVLQVAIADRCMRLRAVRSFHIYLQKVYRWCTVHEALG